MTEPSFTMSDAEKARQKQHQLEKEERQRYAQRSAAAYDMPDGYEHITPDSSLADLQAASQAITDQKARSSLQASRALYTEGARFRVIKDGARLEGLMLFGKTNWSGWSRNLLIGEIITCTGWKIAWGSDSVKVANFTADGVPREASWVSVWPLASLWRPYPMEGFLEPLPELEV